MTPAIQEQIELLELKANDEELLGLLAFSPSVRMRHRLQADEFRWIAVELRRNTIAKAA
jgi:hypothetical protein